MQDQLVEGAPANFGFVANAPACLCMATLSVGCDMHFWCIQRSAINEPTWTGHSGAAGAPRAAAPRPRFGVAANPAIRRQLASPGSTGSQQSASAVDGTASSEASGRGSPGINSPGQSRFGATGIAGVSGVQLHEPVCFATHAAACLGLLELPAMCCHKLKRRELWVVIASRNLEILLQAARRCGRRTCLRSCGRATPRRPPRGWPRCTATPMTPPRCCSDSVDGMRLSVLPAVNLPNIWPLKRTATPLTPRRCHFLNLVCRLLCDGRCGTRRSL